jgi:hypothetical protein
VDAPIVATAGAEDVHVPPVVVLLNTAVDPLQTEVTPVIKAGSALIVTAAVLEHPRSV